MRLPIGDRNRTCLLGQKGDFAWRHGIPACPQQRTFTQGALQVRFVQQPDSCAAQNLGSIRSLGGKQDSVGRREPVNAIAFAYFVCGVAKFNRGLYRTLGVVGGRRP